MEQVFQALIDRSRAALDLKTNQRCEKDPTIASEGRGKLTACR
jgi:hypothetical protein